MTFDLSEPKKVVLQALVLSYNILQLHCRAAIGKSRKGCDRQIFSPILTFFDLETVTFDLSEPKKVVLQALVLSYNILQLHCRAAIGKSRKGCD